MRFLVPRLRLGHTSLLAGGPSYVASLKTAHTVKSFSVSANASIPKSHSPAPIIGVQAALKAASDPSFIPRATLLQKEFSLEGRVAVVTGAQRGLGLEMAEALAEAGATVYCLDLPSKPDPSFEATKTFVEKMQGRVGSARLEYASVDVTNQKAIWDLVAEIAGKEGRLDVCVAAAGILRGEDCLEYSAEEFGKLMRVNVNGVLYTAQAAGRQMSKFGSPGSIVLIASMSGSVTNKVCILTSNFLHQRFGYYDHHFLFFILLGATLGCIQY